jgi:hypothetical protein
VRGKGKGRREREGRRGKEERKKEKGGAEEKRIAPALIAERRSRVVVGRRAVRDGTAARKKEGMVIGKGVGSTAGVECLVGEESGRRLGFQGFEQNILARSHGALTSLSGEQGWQGDERKSPGAPQAAVASRILWPAAPAAGRSKGILGIYKCVDTFFMKIY